MRQTVAVSAALALFLCACSKAREPPEHADEQQSRAGAEREGGPAPSVRSGAERGDSEAQPSEHGDRQPQTLEQQAGTYDPRHDEAPGAGPGAPREGEVPGTGLKPITSPVPTTPQADPSAPPLDVTPTTPSRP